MTRLTRKINRALNAVEEGVNRPLNPSRRRRRRRTRRATAKVRPYIRRQRRARRRTNPSRQALPAAQLTSLRKDYFAKGNELTPSAQVVTGGPMVPPALTRPRRLAGSELMGRLLGTRRIDASKTLRISEVEDVRFLQTLDPIFWTGTRTQKIAQTYMALRINSISLEYVPSASSLIAGTVYLAFFRANDLDWTPAGLTAALSSGSARVNQQFMVHMDPSYLQNRRQEFDVRDVLSFPVAVAYVEGAESSEVFGHLRLHYNYSFSSPTSEELVYQSSRTSLSALLKAAQDSVAPIAAFIQQPIDETSAKDFVRATTASGTSSQNATQFSQKLQLGKVLTFKVQPTGMIEATCDGYTALIDPDHVQEDIDVTGFSEGEPQTIIEPVNDRPLSFKLQIQRASLRYDIFTTNTATFRTHPGVSLLNLNPAGYLKHGYYSGTLVTPPMNAFFDEDIAFKAESDPVWTTEKLTATILRSDESLPFSFNTSDERCWHYVPPGSSISPSSFGNRWVLCLYWLQSETTCYATQDFATSESTFEAADMYTLYRPVLQIVQIVGDYFYGSNTDPAAHVKDGLQYAMWPFTVPSGSAFTQDTVNKAVNSYGFFYASIVNPFTIMPIVRNKLPYQNQPGGMTVTMPIANSRVALQPISLNGYSVVGGSVQIDGSMDPKGFRINTGDSSTAGNNCTFAIMNSFINQSLIVSLKPLYSNLEAFKEFISLPIFDGINSYAPDFWSRYSGLKPPTARSVIEAPLAITTTPPQFPAKVGSEAKDEGDGKEEPFAFQLA